ncbi:MAG TPA: PKD domain-containing protein [Puia sp.]|jgi:hypothetical protein|nr:PKD domain-containing protein [Puia sp.]
MKNFYEATCKKSVLLILCGVFLSLGAVAQQMVTYDTTFGGWNAVVTMDKALAGNDSAAGIVFFPGIGEETTDSSKIVVNGPHYLIRNGIWDGSVPLGNGVHHPFIISLQPPASGYPANSVKPKIDAILARYRIKRNSFYLTGLSMGGWYANQFVCYEPTPGDDTYGRLVRALVVLEGVEPADSTQPYPSLSYPRKMGHYAKACGGRELWVEGSNDWRDMLAGAQNMCDSVPNSASYFQVTYGGGAHCCWNTEYDPSTMWTTPSNSNISQVWGTPQLMNVWQWLLRQGDTTMPAYSTPAPGPPAVNAGVAQTIRLPVSSLTLTGAATGTAGATISSVAWTEVSGPVTANFSAAANLTTTVSGMTTAGTYVFQLKATDNNGLSATSTVTVTVDAANVPPTVSAGSAQTIQLPVSSVTLTGTATGNGGATISSTGWTEVSGPVTATIAAASGLSTGVTGLTTAGTYVFQLKATDNNGLSGTATITVTVQAAPPPVNVPPTASAGSAQTIQLPVSSVTLTGTATGNGGATISSTGWTEVSGPVTATIVNAGGLSTGVTGLTTAGTYVFQLMATDNNGSSTTAAVTITVEAAAPPPVNVPPVAVAGPDQTITLPVSTTTLNGSGSYDTDGTITGYSWIQLSGNSGVTLAGSGQAQATLTGLKAGTYVFQLTVTDNSGAIGVATVTITVNAPNVLPPVANAGPDTTIAMPADSVALNGSRSTDPAGETLTYQWAQVSGPSESMIGASGSATTMAGGLNPGLYVFSLKVTNTSGLSDTASVQVQVVNNKRTAQVDTGSAAFTVYPNPVGSVLTVRFTDANTSGKVLLRVFDLKGRLVVAEQTEVSGGGQLVTFNVSGLARGVYTLEVVAGKARSYQMIVKQ